MKDKNTKEPFDPHLGVSQKISALALSPKYNMTVYYGSGTAYGKHGDHIMISPPYIVTEQDVKHIVTVLTAVIKEVFHEIALDDSLDKDSSNKTALIPASDVFIDSSEASPKSGKG